MGSALNRLHRLLRNPRIDDQVLTAQLLRLLGQGRRLLIALDWTQWHHDLKMLLASGIVGCRAIPVQVAVFNKKEIWRSQNTWEQTFLRSLVSTLKALGQEAVILCDLSFRRVSWLQELITLQQAFVVCLVADLMVYQGTCGGRLLRRWHLNPGQAKARGWVSSGRIRPSTSGSSGSRRRGRRNPGGWRPILKTPSRTL